jgi:hypothetical protein
VTRRPRPGHARLLATWTTLGALSLVAVVVAVTVTVSGCAADPPARTPAPRRPAEARPRAPALRVTSELGDLDPRAVTAAFGALDDGFLDCQKQGLARIEVLSGAVTFFLRIGADGAAKWAYLERSEIGDRETEKCLLELVSAAHWPRPTGGDAEVRHSLELPLQSTRPPVDWSSDRVAGALGQHESAIDRCKSGIAGSFSATIYVGEGGKVLGAGVTATSRGSEDTADCLARLLVSMTGLPSPGSWPAKVSFDL